MQDVWAYGASRSFQDLLRLATGQELSIDAYVEQAMMSSSEKLQQARTRLKNMESHATERPLKEKNPLDAHIRIVHGEKLIGDSKN